jgi:hypothetical protein
MVPLDKEFIVFDRDVLPLCGMLINLVDDMVHAVVVVVDVLQPSGWSTIIFITFGIHDRRMACRHLLKNITWIIQTSLESFHPWVSHDVLNQGSILFVWTEHGRNQLLKFEGEF